MSAYWCHVIASLMEAWPHSRRVQPEAFGRRNNCSVSSALMMVSASPRRTRQAFASSWSSSTCAASWSSSLRKGTVLLVMLTTVMIPPASPLSLGISSRMFHLGQLFVCLAWFSQPASCYGLNAGMTLTWLDPCQRPIWLRIPWPVSSSVPKPITKPSIAKRPFHVSAKLLKPNRDWVELVMFLIMWKSLTWVRHCFL